MCTNQKIPVNSNTIDLIVQQAYGVPYQFLNYAEASHLGPYEYLIDGVLSEPEKEIAEKLKAGFISYECGKSVMNLLCSDGHIVPGFYVVRIVW